MDCKIEGCGRLVMYSGQQVCQMHYFRFMRNGSYEKKKTERKYRRSNPAGYQLIHKKDHPLSDKNEYVYEHRYVVYEATNGVIESCALCGKAETWETCCIDHIDNDVTNNSLSNLRVCCRACNSMRGHMIKENSFNSRHMITHDGLTMSPWKWASTFGISVCGKTIQLRKDKGYSDYEALFGKKRTHHNTTPKKRVYREWSK